MVNSHTSVPANAMVVTSGECTVKHKYVLLLIPDSVQVSDTAHDNVILGQIAVVYDYLMMADPHTISDESVRLCDSVLISYKRLFRRHMEIECNLY